MRHLTLIFLFCTAAFAADDNCSLEQKLEIGGATPADCRASAKKYSEGAFKDCYEKSGEAWFAALAVREEACVKETMDKELDKRLLPLKATPKPFKKEMDLQKDWNTAVTAFCKQWGEGTSGSYNEPGCRRGFWEYRFEQAKAINEKTLTVSTGTPSKKAPASFQRVVKKICELPPSLWKGGTIPRNCSRLLLADMENKKLFALPGDE